MRGAVYLFAGFGEIEKSRQVPTELFQMEGLELSGRKLAPCAQGPGFNPQYYQDKWKVFYLLSASNVE